MFPAGISPRQMKRMMKQMGITMDEVEAEQVIIIQKNKKIVIENPQVSRVVAMGQKTYQIIGEEREEPLDLEAGKPSAKTGEELVITDEDIQLVASQTGVTKEEAEKALRKTGGDIAEAIILLKNG